MKATDYRRPDAGGAVWLGHERSLPHSFLYVQTRLLVNLTGHRAPTIRSNSKMIGHIGT